MAAAISAEALAPPSPSANSCDPSSVRGGGPSLREMEAARNGGAHHVGLAAAQKHVAEEDPREGFQRSLHEATKCIKQNIPETKQQRKTQRRHVQLFN